MMMFSEIYSRLFKGRKSDFAEFTLANRSIEELTSDLVGSKGEMSGMAIANQILDLYDGLDEEKKAAFFTFVTKELDIKSDMVLEALEQYQQESNQISYQAFMEASEPKRQELIRRLNQVPDATRRLVKMRTDLLKLKRGNEVLGALDVDFKHLLSSWFNRGFLILEPISWETPAHILEKIIAYEAVHEISSWAELRDRLEPEDRKCFAFFHPAMPDEPLIFVEVAFCAGIPNSIQKVLSKDRPILKEEEADTAVFYSISNCQSGLAGISFGNSLIKQVVADLGREFENLKTFVTLSPIPTMSKWMEEQELAVDSLDDELVQALAARYLVEAKRRDKGPYDPVARFHLGNGAILHAIHAQADMSEKGKNQSFGAMVNYLYDLDRISENHERFAGQNEVITSAQIKDILSQAD